MSSTSEADAQSVLTLVTTSLDLKRHKGQAGKIAVIGGCREYTGAPFCFKNLTSVRKRGDKSRIKWLEKLINGWKDLIIGPGLGRDTFLLECASKIMLLAGKVNVPFVVDGDGLFLVTNSIDLVKSYPLAVLTPNVNEYKRLF